MANPEHLEILRQGVEVWNQWRKENPDIQPNLGEGYPNVNFNGIELSGANLSFAYLIEARMCKSNLHKAHLSFADLFDADLSYANLKEASLNAAFLAESNLQNSDLREADLSFANLTNTDLSHATLVRAQILNAQFHLTKLNNTDFTEAELGWTSFNDIDLSSAKGLEFVIHTGPSSIGLDTIYRSKGNIPEVFLRKAGVSETFIAFSKSLVGKAIDFYSCFISFTEIDDLFSERIYNDLQASGVRCWRWKEDAKWGKTLMRSIDEAVRVYDKLIVICSEASLKSPAVVREIERALQKEDDLARRGEESEVLFPIRLDDYIFTDWNHHRKADVLAKHVGDFRDWKEPELYRKSVARLILNLKAESRSTDERL